MFIQKKFLVESLAKQIELIKLFPLGTVVSNGPNGLVANHIPFTLDEVSPSDQEDGVKFRLRAHFAKINEQGPDLETAEEVMVIFQAPDSYVSPSYYKGTKPTTGKVVPTWDFSCVHVYGKPRVIDDADFIFRQMNDLTTTHESRVQSQWKVNDAPENYRNLLVKAVRGLEITVTRTEGKWKLSQDKPKEDIAGVIEGFKNQGEHYNADEVQKVVDSNNWR